ncbi:MAG: purine-binding chemotaxis protein CheW [Cyclobacteriaceae bacterium]|jgi:purine-binding chemotaxis protein CheW
MSRAIFPGLNTSNDIRRKELHEKFSEEIKGLSGKKVHLIVFDLEKIKFALEIEKIDEVVATPAINKLPKSPTYIPGIAAIRGTDIIILDLGSKLGLDQISNIKHEDTFTIVVASQRFTIGILTPLIPINIIVSGEHIQPTGMDIAGSPEDETYIKGIIRHGEERIYFIDIDELLEGDRTK